MSVVNTGEIVGYRINKEDICCECARYEEVVEVTQPEIITTKNVNAENRLYFCDRCKKQLTPRLVYILRQLKKLRTGKASNRNEQKNRQALHETKGGGASMEV